MERKYSERDISHGGGCINCQQSFFHFLSARNAVNKYKKATKIFTLNCSLWLFLNFY